MFTFPLISQNTFQILLTVLRTVSSLHPISRFKEKSLNVGPISKKSFSKVKTLAILILKGENFNHIGNLNDNGFQELKIRSLLKQKKINFLGTHTRQLQLNTILPHPPNY